MRKRVFISFDFDNDQTLKTFLVGQSKLNDSPFSVIDFSLREAAPMKTWEAKAKQRISQAHVFIVMLGPRTRFASGVKKEVAMANQLGKQRFQIIGHSYGTRDWAVPGAGKVYRWDWDNLKKLLA